MKNTQLKQKLIEQRGRKCECCGLTEWQSQPINLEVHHIDGNSHNDNEENLQLLCPNCHSYTANYSKNITKRHLSDEEFASYLREAKTIHQALLNAHLSTASTNYARARRLIQEYKLTHLYKKEQTINYCVDCGCPIDNNAVRCVACSHKAQRKADRPSKEELEQLLYNNTFVQVGKMFGVSDNSIRKWCKGYGLPFHAADYKRP